MSHELISSSVPYDSFPSSVLLVRDVAGDCRQVDAYVVLLGRVRGTDVLSSPQAVRDFLRVRLGELVQEVFAAVHLDALNRVIDYVEMFRGTVRQPSVYAREVVREAMVRNSSGLILVHNHPSGAPQPSRADEAQTQALRAARALVDVRVLDHLIVAGMVRAVHHGIELLLYDQKPLLLRFDHIGVGSPDHRRQKDSWRRRAGC